MNTTIIITAKEFYTAEELHEIATRETTKQTTELLTKILDIITDSACHGNFEKEIPILKGRAESSYKQAFDILKDLGYSVESIVYKTQKDNIKAFWRIKW